MMTMHRDVETVRRVVTAGMMIGVGMGGFVDGIVFHQILQFHNMLSARIPNDTLVGAKVNMVWDGLFHAGVWLATAIGITMLWRAAKRSDVVLSTHALVGALWLGWGMFNVVEGVIDHHVLALHHVYEAAGASWWDYVFLASGVAFIATGWLMIRRESRGGRADYMA